MHGILWHTCDRYTSLSVVIGEDDTAQEFTFGPRHCSDTDFADDIVLLSNTINQAWGYCTELDQQVIQLPSISTHPKT